MEKGENLNRRNLPTSQQLRRPDRAGKRRQHTRHDREDRRKMPGQYCTGQPLSEKLLKKDFLQKIIGLQKKGRHGLRIISVF